MKRLIGVLFCSVAVASGAYASNSDANLNIKVAGTGKDNTYFLCVNGVGCVSMFAAQHGRVFPLSPGQINRIFLVNSGTLRTYFQELPSSCKVTVNANQTLTVKGKIVKSGANDNTYINKLECSVA
jgi:hypothetical protein